MSEKITVLVVEQLKKPYAKEICGLADMQAVVGGPIEAVYPFEDKVAIVCNRDGKLTEQTANRLLRNGCGVPYDVICGTFFITGLGDEAFTSLTDKQLRTYTKMFSDDLLHIVSRTPAQKRSSKEKER